MEKIKKAIFFSIPMSICNLRCSYCYLAQRPEKYQGRQIDWKITPEKFQEAFSRKRIGGLAYFNFCADGETLLVRDIEKYVKVLLEEGHYVEFITNATITPVLDKFLTWDKKILSHLEFKCSFHYLQLKKKNLLEVYSSNIHKIWAAGASACIEITPSDDQLKYLDEIKEYSLKEFGAFPHITIARDDHSHNIGYLTELDMKKYDEIWSSFDSCFWKFKKSIFNKKQTGFCYAGMWSLYINIENGDASQCYCGRKIGNVYNDISQRLPEKPICRCKLPHCYNGHAFLTLGLIPEIDTANYGDIRDREKKDGTHWLNPEFKNFINGKLKFSNNELSSINKNWKILILKMFRVLNLPKKIIKSLLLRNKRDIK